VNARLTLVSDGRVNPGYTNPMAFPLHVNIIVTGIDRISGINGSCVICKREMINLWFEFL
jgi:hypothetical protein